VARAGLSPAVLVDVALGLIEDEGPAALTLSAVAGRAGVAAPSLYKHVKNLAELRELISARIMGEIAEQTAEATLGRARDEALRALMDAYRTYVTAHPHRYAAMLQTPDEAGVRLIEIMEASLRGYGLKGSEVTHAIRCMRSAAHGFAVLETAGGFGLPERVDESWDLLIRMITAGLSRRP
jgi:AcrR family transcriptional regulator